MDKQRNDKNSLVPNTVAGVASALIGAALVAYFIAIWTGTVSGPTNPAFWQQLAPLIILVILTIILLVPSTRQFIFNMLRLLKKAFVWLFGLRITDENRRNKLLNKAKKEALTEVARRNTESEAFNIAYTNDSPLDGVDWFLLTDYSGLSGSGPMKNIRITAPKDEIVMTDKDGPTVPEDHPDDRFRFSGEVTDRGIRRGIDFRIFWEDADGYPRWNFYHVPPSNRLLKGAPIGSFGDMKYGNVITSHNLGDGSLTVKWASTGQVIGRLVPSGPAWKVESGQREGRVRPEFRVQDELGLAPTLPEGVELLRIHTLRKEDKTSR